MKEEQKFVRKGMSIFQIGKKGKLTLFKKHDSINEAKQQSHRLQIMNGGLGQGSLSLGVIRNA